MLLCAPCALSCMPLQSDKDILEHIVYDFNDHEMMEALRPSIEEAQPIHSQNLALDYIGKRASQVMQRRSVYPTLLPICKGSFVPAHTDMFVSSSKGFAN